MFAQVSDMQLDYERGTLILTPTCDDEDPASLAGVLWDERTGAWRAPAWRYRAIRRALRGALDDRVGLPSERTPAFPPTLRPYQEAAVEAWRSAGGRGQIVLPTGAGKTRTALAAIARLGRSALVLAPTRLLVGQWIDALTGAGYATVGKLSDGERRIETITVATFAGAFHHAPRLGNLFSLLVVDEAHHFGAGHGDEALELSAAPYRLGLTATPNTDEVRAKRVEELLGPVVYRETISDLAGTWLAPFDVESMAVDLTPREMERYRAAEHRWRTAFREFRLTDKRRSWLDFVRLAGRTDGGRDALACWRRCRRIAAGARAKIDVVAELLSRHRERRVLIFVADNATAYALARRLLVPAITCEIGQPERAEVLQRFEQGNLRALVSARVLNEGVDVPAADVAIVAGGSHGAREFVQRVGRVLRPMEGKRALVVEIVARNTHEEQGERRRLALVAPRAL